MTRQPLGGHLGSGKSILKPTESGRSLFFKGDVAYAQSRPTYQPLARGKVVFHYLRRQPQWILE
jgi:hypothetical protein